MMLEIYNVEVLESVLKVQTLFLIMTLLKFRNKCSYIVFRQYQKHKHKNKQTGNTKPNNLRGQAYQIVM